MSTLTKYARISSDTAFISRATPKAPLPQYSLRRTGRRPAPWLATAAIPILLAASSALAPLRPSQAAESDSAPSPAADSAA